MKRDRVVAALLFSILVVLNFIILMMYHDPILALFGVTFTLLAAALWSLAAYLPVSP